MAGGFDSAASGKIECEKFRCGCLRRGWRASADKFSRIQNPVWIQRVLERGVNAAAHVARRLRPPAFFCNADAVLAGDDTAPVQHLFKQLIQRAF